MNTIVRYGAVAGAAIAVLLFAPYFIFGAKPEWMEVGEIVGYGSMVLCLSATVFAMRHERARHAAAGFSRLFGVGVGVSAVAGLVFGVATWAFYSLVGDALPQAIYEFYVHKITTSGAPADAVASQLAELDGMKGLLFNRPLQGAVMFATVFLIGVVESALGAWFVGRRRREPAAA